MHRPAMSPPFPATPSTASSNYSSHFGFHPYHSHGRPSHSRSTSGSTHPRSTSPATSIMSVGTSMSSVSSGHRPPVSATSTSSLHASSKPKKRLYNRERKAICKFYQDNPHVRQEDIAAQWGVERSTVSKILKNKEKWLHLPEEEEDQVAKHRYVFPSPQVRKGR